MKRSRSPAISGERERFILELDRDARAEVTLYTKKAETLAPTGYGENLELDGKVRPPRNFGNPGAFDFRNSSGREVVIVGGCVVEPPAISGERERFILELDRDALAQVTLYTKPGETLPPLHYGQNLELDGKVRPPRNFGNPGAFDYRNYLARQDIYWAVSAAASGVRVLPGHCGNAFQKAVMDLRQTALAR